MKISKAFAEFRKNEILALGKADSTNEGYVYTEKAAVEFFHDINVKRITLDGVHDFYIWLRKERSKNTSREYICKLRTVLEYCNNKGIHTIDPASIKTPRKEKKMPRFLSSEEFNVFLEEVGRQHRGYSNINRVRNVVITKMLFTTGLRISELCALNRNDIHDRQFSVVGKSKNPRPCFITKELEQDINTYLSMRTDNDPALFVSEQTGQRITKKTVQSIFRRVSKASGVHSVTPHTLRHSYATLLVDDGVDIRYVAELLGHQSLETTQKYTHVRDYRLHQIYEMAMGNLNHKISA